MTARRYKSLHFGDMTEKNVIFHREHRSKNGRNGNKKRMGIWKRHGKNAQPWKKGKQVYVTDEGIITT